MFKSFALLLNLSLFKINEYLFQITFGLVSNVYGYLQILQVNGHLAKILATPQADV